MGGPADLHLDTPLQDRAQTVTGRQRYERKPCRSSQGCEVTIAAVGNWFTTGASAPYSLRENGDAQVARGWEHQLAGDGWFTMRYLSANAVCRENAGYDV